MVARTQPDQRSTHKKNLGTMTMTRNEEKNRNETPKNVSRSSVLLLLLHATMDDGL